jgi:cysteinyl-tRNA synthetase
MDADFNTPDALAVIFDLARQINTARASADPQAHIDRLRRTLVYLLDVLGLDLKATSAQDEVPIAPLVALLEYIQAQVDLVESNGAAANEPPALEQVVDELLDSRRRLRAAKQFALADEVRVRLKDLGVIVEDKPGGESTWRIER